MIQGGDELAKGVVQVKDLVEGARLAEQITDNAEWREGRPAQVEDIAGAVLFLLSPAGAYITGANIEVAGGYRLSLADTLQ